MKILNVLHIWNFYSEHSNIWNLPVTSNKEMTKEWNLQYLLKINASAEQLVPTYYMLV